MNDAEKRDAIEQELCEVDQRGEEVMTAIDAASTALDDVTRCYANALFSACMALLMTNNPTIIEAASKSLKKFLTMADSLQNRN